MTHDVLLDQGQAIPRTPAGPAHRAPGRRTRPARRALLCGVGSIGRPLAIALLSLDLTHLTLVDPKRYVPHSVASQCEVADVHQSKVDVVAAMLRRAGLPVASYAADICDLPDGVLQDDSLVISCTDNSRALLRANRLAARMQCPLLKVNVEPAFDCVSVRAYRPCSEDDPCAECQLSDRHYLAQLHPHSCEGAVAARRTAGSRALSAAAAQLAWRAASDILDAGPAADDWFGWETLQVGGRARPTRSRLARYAACRWDHSARWVNMFRLTQGPAELRLDQLMPPRFHGALGAVTFAFDSQVARWACCLSCRWRVRMTRWVTSVSCRVGSCPECDSPLAPYPYGMRQQLPGPDLRDVLDLPLAAWGVAPGAVIQVTTGSHIRSFVVGPLQVPLQVA